jgi:acetylornithine/succinyldiaminopimelate/putrescine aminotransferase
MFSGNALAGAAAITALDVLIDEKRAERSRMLGQKLINQFSAIKSSYFDQVSGKRLFLSLFIYEAHPLGLVTSQRLAALLQKRRVLTNSYRCRIRLALAW